MIENTEKVRNCLKCLTSIPEDAVITHENIQYLDNQGSRHTGRYGICPFCTQPIGLPPDIKIEKRSKIGVR
jgi:flavoprotein